MISDHQPSHDDVDDLEEGFSTVLVDPAFVLDSNNNSDKPVNDEPNEDGYCVSTNTILLGIVITVLVLFLALGLGLGLSRPVPSNASGGGGHAATVDSPETFLQRFAIYHGASQVVSEDELTWNDDDDIVIQVSTGLDGDQNLLHFYGNGETIQLKVSSNNVQLDSIAIRFGTSKQLRVFAASAIVKITLPMSCWRNKEDEDDDEGECGVFEINVYGLVRSNDGNSWISSRAEILRHGWTCARPSQRLPTCKSHTCAATVDGGCALKVSTFESCLEQFQFSSKVRRLVQQRSAMTTTTTESNCVQMYILESVVVTQCSQFLQLDFATLAAKERIRADEFTRTQCLDDGICSGVLECSAFTMSTYRMMSIDSSSPTTLLSFRPSAAPSSAPLGCHVNCTCPMLDPCCCRDGACDASACPDSFF